MISGKPSTDITAGDSPPECRTSQDEKLGLGITIYNNSYTSAETHKFPWKPVTEQTQCDAITALLQKTITLFSSSS